MAVSQQNSFLGGKGMQSQFNQQMNPNIQPSTAMPRPMNHGGHEVFDVHEVLSGFIGSLNQFLMFEQHIKDPELLDILNRQRQFITDQYNITVESFRSGQDPSHPTTSYQMNQSNNITFGLSPSQPSKPNQQINQIGDKCISSLMLSCAKSNALSMTMAAAEVTNPVVRRVLQDSIPNMLEMAYEVFLYQNKMGYYQVPQLQDQDMQLLMNSYAPSNGMTNMMPNQMNGNMMQ